MEISELALFKIDLELAPTTPEGWPDEDFLLERLQDAGALDWSRAALSLAASAARNL